MARIRKRSREGEDAICNELIESLHKLHEAYAESMRARGERILFVDGNGEDVDAHVDQIVEFIASAMATSAPECIAPTVLTNTG
jgi:thymidylate kinase